jgi:hypothetical protein
VIPANYRPDCSSCEPTFRENDRSLLELVNGGPHIQRRPIIDARRNIWTNDFETKVVELMGGDWPEVVVDKYQTNHLGERRYVGSRMYRVAE